jgi:Ca2+-binding RTX toxin-like protein
MAATAESLNYVQKMFIAFLGRAGAPAGLEYYAALIDADEESGKAILFDDLFNSEQGQSLYAGLETYEVVEIIFQNVMGRPPETGGLIYWTNQIDDGVINVAEAAAIIADGAAADADDLAVLEAKTTAADAVTAELEANPDLVAGYQANFDLARDSLGDVDASNVDAFVANVSAEVSSIANGYASSSVLTTGNDTVVGTDGFVDEVTGTVGTDATLNAGDSITDAGTDDGDIVNLSGDGDAALDPISGFETINIDFAAQQIGGALNVTGVANDIAELNISTADTVEVVGIEVDGETEVTVTGNLAATIATTGVTSLTATQNDVTAFAVSGDASLATLTVTGANDAGVIAVLANNDSTVSISGDGANDVADISAVGALALDVNNDIDNITLSGNGGAVDVTLTNVDAANAAYTTTGDQDVTLTGANDVFDGASLTESGTGTTSVSISSGGDADLSSMGVVSGGIGLASAVGATDLTIASGNVISANDTNAGITLTNAGNDGSVTLDLTGRAGALVSANFDSVTINTGADAATIASLDLDDANDTTVRIDGANDITVTGASAVDAIYVTSSGGDLDFDTVTASGLNASYVDLRAPNGDATVGDVTTTGAEGYVYVYSGTNDVTAGAIDTSGATSDTSVNLQANTGDVTTQEITTNDSNVSLYAVGDVAVTGGATNDIDAGTGNVTLEGATVSVDDITGADVSLTATNDTAASDAGQVAASGDVTITGGNWTLDSDIDTAATGTLTVSGGAATDVTGAAAVTASSIVIDATGNVDLGNDVNTSVVNAESATGNVSAEITGSSASGVTVVTGTGDDTITTSANDVIFNITTGDGADTVDTTSNDLLLDTGAGDDIVTVTEALAAAVVNTGADDDQLTITSVAAGITADTGTGDDIVTVDAASVTGGATITTGEGADQVDISDTGNDVVVTTGAGADVITLADDTAADVNTGGDDDSITLGNDVAATIDAGDGNDTLTLAANDYSDDGLSIANVEVVDISAGAATISAATFAGDSAFELQSTGADISNDVLSVNVMSTDATTVDASEVTTTGFTQAGVTINGNDGDDVLTHNGYSGVVNGGDGNDTIYGLGSADGGNDVLNGNDGDDTIDGGAGVDIITGGAGQDTLTGGAGADTFAFSAGDSTNDTSTADIIVDYTEGVDSITAAGGVGVEVANGAGMNEAQLIDAANDAFVAGNDIYIAADANDSGNAYVYVDNDASGDWSAGDYIIVLQGIDNDADITAGDFT